MNPRAMTSPGVVKISHPALRLRRADAQLGGDKILKSCAKKTHPSLTQLPKLTSAAKIRDEIHKKINYFKRALPVKLRPSTPPRLNGQDGPFFRPPKTTF